MDNREAVNWLINISADIGKAEHSDLWYYEQALTEIKDMLESAQFEERKESLCKKVRALCEESKIEFFFVGGGESTWSVTNDKHIKKIVECHKAQLSQEGTTKDATSDTISRQAAIDAIMGEPTDAHYPSWYAERLEQLPSAQPERIKGHWVEIASSNHTYKCSVCGRLLANITDGKNNVAKNYPYCHCGADMRGEQDG